MQGKHDVFVKLLSNSSLINDNLQAYQRTKSVLLIRKIHIIRSVFFYAFNPGLLLTFAARFYDIMCMFCWHVTRETLIVSFKRQNKLITNLYTKYKILMTGFDLNDMITLHTLIEKKTYDSIKMQLNLSDGLPISSRNQSYRDKSADQKQYLNWIP